MRQVGGPLGIAVMGAIVAARTSRSLRPGDPSRIAYLHRFHDALKVAALLALAGAIVALAAIRKTPDRAREPGATPKATSRI